MLISKYMRPMLPSSGDGPPMQVMGAPSTSSIVSNAINAKTGAAAR